MILFISMMAVAVIAIAVLSYNFYLSVNRGLSASARHQQTTRIGIASVIALIPFTIGGVMAWGGFPTDKLLLVACICVAWGVTYPLLFHLSNRRVSPDYDNYMDITLALYLFGLLSAMTLAGFFMARWGLIMNVIVAILEIIAVTIIIAQWVYFAMYRSCIDNNGMKIVRDTNYNEIIEFSRSYPVVYAISIAVVIMAVVTAIAAINLRPEDVDVAANYPGVIVMLALALAVGLLIFKGKRSPIRRAGIIALYLTVKDYADTNLRYATDRAATLASLKVSRLGEPWEKPTSIVLVIGESASRDYMSAFTPMEHDTTPWLRERFENDPEHFIPFPNAYASAMHTVAVLEKSLTECNQYNDKTFYTSASIIDMARAAGYHIHWYSNQGHLGAADTPVTLVAETADVARWTKQELNKVQHDMSLIDFLDEVDPGVNNLIVLHLKGSHFNFLNRYPREATVWGTPGVQDNILNYENSIRYTDSFLSRVFDICRNRFNMQAMLYFSDHGTIPSRRRTPGFDGFGHIRIPMFVYLGDTYISKHPSPTAALRANSDKYFTNDLIYATMCGLMDVESDAYDPGESLADTRYRFTRDMLLSFDRTIHIADDPTSRHSHG